MDHNLLVSELQSLVVESKRRNPEVKEAGEAALEILRHGPQPRELLASRAETLLAPVTLGCRTKNAKIVGISIAALQRLVALGGVPLASLPDVLATLGSVAGQAVDIQLKILQTLLSILTYCKDMHGDTLGTALLLCFKLQDSRVSVVSSTAAATLRQAIMVVFDRVAATDDAGAAATLPLTLTTPKQVSPKSPKAKTPPKSPPNKSPSPVHEAVELTVTPAAMDAFCILSDLCLLTAGYQGSSSLSLWSTGDKAKPRMLKLSALSRTFGLELIESILSGYEGVVKAHPELLHLLRHSLHPLILRLQSERPSFAVALRICRLLYVLIRSYADQLPLEVESYLLWLIRMGAGDEDERKEHRRDAPPWLHVLALEILRGICGDPALLRAIWAQYDQPNGPKLFAKLVSALGRLINEKPALLGVGVQMHGHGIPASSTDNINASYFDMGLGMMASAASVGVSAVGNLVASGGGGLGPHSAMKQRLVEQHDKAEAPPVPETYVYLLGVQSLCAIAESISTASAAEDTAEAAKGMAESAWPALLAALSYCIVTDLSDGVFAEVLTALQDFTVACGTLGLSTPRDAFLNTLAKYAAPPPVVSAMQHYLESGAPSKGSAADSLGLTALTGQVSGPPSLSERNLACLRSLISVAQTLGGSIGPAWHDVLETLQNANYLIASVPRGTQQRRPTPSTPQSPSGRSSGEFTGPRPEMLQDLDNDHIQAAVNMLFEQSRDLDDEAFSTFVTALCRLSAEMIGMDSVVDLSTPPASGLSPVLSSVDGRRRTSGLYVSGTMKSGERSFGLAKLRTVAVLNLQRLVNRDPGVGWSVVTQHLLGVARHITAPTTIRIQASDTLGELLLASLRITAEPRVQHQVFDVLVRQVDVNPVSSTVATDYDVRSSGYQTLNQILESSGHSLEVGWPTIFGMLNDVCKRPESGRATPPTAAHRGDANLVRIAFPSLQLICTDFLSSLDNAAMRQCISCLGCFGQQQDDVNITLAAIGLLWSVSDAVQADSKDLWFFLLLELLELARDPRLEVRSSAMQTLFRCIELYGSTLVPQLWEDVFWKVIFPLLEDMRGDESQVLALTSVGSIFGSFLSQIHALPSATAIFQHLLDRLERSFVSEPRNCSTAALKTLERVLTASTKGSPVLELTWKTFVRMGDSLSEGDPYTQENLVALVRVSRLLRDRLEWSEGDPRARQLSNILRAAVEYGRSPDYRADVDSMPPLQSSVVDLVASSSAFGPSLVLSDLAKFAGLPFGAEGKQSFVALCKFCLPAMADVFEKHDVTSLYTEGTVEAVLSAYAAPIKLKYECPPANRYGDDPPLWRTAITCFVRVLQRAMPRLESLELPPERYEALWERIMDVYAGMLLADDGEVPTSAASANRADDDETFVLPALTAVRDAVAPRLVDARVPRTIVEAYAETLRKASVLYHYDVRVPGGTTAPVIAEAKEATRYWALEQLITNAGRPRRRDRPADNGMAEDDDGAKGRGDGAEDNARRVAAYFVPSVLKRFESTLRHFLSDAKLRGQMPFTRVREDEILFVLRHIVTLRLWPDMANGALTPTTRAAASPRAHLFRYYPLLLELAFVPAHLPSMWILPSEHRVLFEDEFEEGEEGSETDAGDGSDLIQVSVRDLARRALELVGLELGLGAGM
ncbi:hypothetical protein CC85DRAFT_283171 [Cutaneotrichosporon oleaginosum]|uniref:Uncharacterized protein n=1 Tax=Cutaneotrichosporon oleaginosum TaxID=879819 RepID=A0A0J1BAB8_9TREE|nr:uncharacterized protein CC85DRAFT_283171 [Cutaneotrichosporon oleaginosum]KLT44869.1 hypothetical protein CC85DRAFT_283171 [Cutaneotrichosporon oleaginosum]